MDLGLLLLRVVLGLLAMGYGAQGLFGWFRGGGWEGATRFLARHGYPAPRVTAAATAVVQMAAGAGLVAGVLTPLMIAALVGVTVNAVALCRRRGLWALDGGYEYPLVALAALTALALSGPGAYSIDALTRWAVTGAAPGVAALLVGAAAGAAVLRRRRRAGAGLVALDDVTDRLGLVGRVDGGVRSIRVDDIVGSVDKAGEFDRAFRPRRAASRDRLAALARAFPHGMLPTIEVYEVGGRYFVQDGHHRVRLARSSGAQFIDAAVTHIPAPFELPADVDDGHLLHTEQQQRLLERSGLLRARPDAVISCSQPQGYAEIWETITAHGYDLMHASGRVVPAEEAALSWYVNVYRPAVDAVRAQPLPDTCGEVPDGDVFLWAYKQRRALRTSDPTADFAAVARTAPHQRFDRNPDRARPAHTPLQAAHTI